MLSCYVQVMGVWLRAHHTGPDVQQYEVCAYSECIAAQKLLVDLRISLLLAFKENDMHKQAFAPSLHWLTAVSGQFLCHDLLHIGIFGP
jgi:hypothetical protein